MAAQTEDEAVEWLERVAMRPMLESLLESVCKDKPDNLHNYAITWMRETYGELAEEAACAALPDGDWAMREDVEPTPEGLMAYLKEVEATSILEAIIERAIRAQPENMVAYVIDEFDVLRSDSPEPLPVEGGLQAASSFVSGASQFAISVHPKAPQLIAAVEDGDVDTARALLEEGVPPNCKGQDGAKEKTALMYAAEGEFELIKLLLDFGASIDFQTKHGETALMSAIKYNDGESVQALLDAGADYLNVRDISGMTALDFAQDDEDMLRLLDPAAADALAARKKAPPTRGKTGPRRGSVSSESIDPKKNSANLDYMPRYEKSADDLAAIDACISGHLLFKDLDEVTKHALILSMSERNVEAGDTVISQGEDGDFFYIVDSGSLDCFVAGEGIAPPGRHVMTYVEGTNFGELALMCTRAAIEATAGCHAVQPVACCRVPARG